MTDQDKFNEKEILGNLIRDAVSFAQSPPDREALFKAFAFTFALEGDQQFGEYLTTQLIEKIPPEGEAFDPIDRFWLMHCLLGQMGLPMMNSGKRGAPTRGADAFLTALAVYRKKIRTGAAYEVIWEEIAEAENVSPSKVKTNWSKWKREVMEYVSAEIELQDKQSGNSMTGTESKD